jgi:topoisomerase-4 subunit B
MMDKNTSVEQLLSFTWGKNTPDRQEFIIKNLKVGFRCNRRNNLKEYR